MEFGMGLAIGGVVATVLVSILAASRIGELKMESYCANCNGRKARFCPYCAVEAAKSKRDAKGRFSK